jgi:four helix bundle protein
LEIVDKFFGLANYLFDFPGLSSKPNLVNMENKKEFARKVNDLKVYQMSFDLAMEIFRITREFPKEEKYALTDQIRRSSRSVCSNLAEGWYKRRYLAAFISKLTDSIQESAETQIWLEFALACGYLDAATFERLHKQNDYVTAQLITMEIKAKSFCLTK